MVLGLFSVDYKMDGASSIIVLWYLIYIDPLKVYSTTNRAETTH